jgi:quinol monooxygenase YgiN
MSVFVSVIIKSKVGHSADLKEILLELVDNSRSEKGCLQFDLYQSTDNENMFIISEEWVDRLWFDIYSQQDYFGRFQKEAEAQLEQVTLHQTVKIA